MNHSVGSASSLDSHAHSESSSQSQGTRWEEQQKLLALEQLCGVFRVDLGHMRSLRLFFRSARSGVKGHEEVTRRSRGLSLAFFRGILLFSACFCHHSLCCCSDEACTSGQLVIASRESQYKILHFHHAGLDKLADVFQQWKCCRETQIKDQVGGRGLPFIFILFFSFSKRFVPTKQKKCLPVCHFLSGVR